MALNGHSAVSEPDSGTEHEVRRVQRKKGSVAVLSVDMPAQTGAINVNAWHSKPAGCRRRGRREAIRASARWPRGVMMGKRRWQAWRTAREEARLGSLGTDQKKRASWTSRDDPLYNRRGRLVGGRPVALSVYGLAGLHAPEAS